MFTIHLLSSDWEIHLWLWKHFNEASIYLCVPFIWRSRHFFGKLFVFLFPILLLSVLLYFPFPHGDYYSLLKYQWVKCNFNGSQHFLFNILTHVLVLYIVDVRFKQNKLDVDKHYRHQSSKSWELWNSIWGSLSQKFILWFLMTNSSEILKLYAIFFKCLTYKW